MVESDIILIGPIGTGKSTLSKLEKLNLPQYPMDELCWPYYKEIGYDEKVPKQIQEQEGFPGVYRYWKPFEAHAVERLLGECHNCVINFGAGNSLYEDEALFTRIENILWPYQNVVLVLPSPNLDKSAQILRERTQTHGWNGVADGFDFHEHFVKHHSNHDLAKKFVYTRGQLPEQSRDEVIAFTT